MIANRFLQHFYKYKRKAQIQRWATTTQTPSRLKVLFFGTDSFSLPSLKALHQHNNDTDDLGVVTSFKSPANCVRIYGEEQRLQLLRWPVAADVCQRYDLGVVVSFGHLIPSQIINAFPLGMVNVHASLLPRWRGAAPIIYAIMHGDPVTGVSIMRIEPKHFDIGNILAQRSVPIKPDILMPELHDQLASEGAELLLQVISGYPESFSNPQKQNDAEATFAPKITAAFTEISWNEMSAHDVYNRYRALFGYKTLRTMFQNKTLQLLEVKLPPSSQRSILDAAAPPGTIDYCRERKCLQVRCAGDSYVEVFRVHIEGKKAMSATDFNNGFLKKLKKYEHHFKSNINLVCC